MKIAKGHQPVMPYLILKNAEGFIDFTKKYLMLRKFIKVMMKKTQPDCSCRSADKRM